MTPEEGHIWMEFIRTDRTDAKYDDEFVVLLETGIRVSEFCGLTKDDVDFEIRKIRVGHQFVRERGGTYYVEQTKTECGRQFNPMTDNVYRSLENAKILTNKRL